MTERLPNVNVKNEKKKITKWIETPGVKRPTDVQIGDFEHKSPNMSKYTRNSAGQPAASRLYSIVHRHLDGFNCRLNACSSLFHPA